MKAIACLTLGVIFAALMIAFLLAGLTIAKAGVLTCLVPADYTKIQAAVDDPDCTDIELGSQVFTENVIISRTVTIQGKGPANTVVDGDGIGDVFTIVREISQSKPITVTLDGLGITNGQSGVFIHLTRTISDIPSDETSIYVYLKNCLISDNAINGIEQAAEIGKTETLVDACTVSGNSGPGISNFSGGVWGTGTADLKVSKSTISNNSGVGIFNFGCPRGSCKSSVRLYKSTVSGNLGSGIYAGLGGDMGFVIINSTISGNTAVKGGGIYGCNSLNLLNSTVSNNSADSGGGIYIIGSSDPYGCSGRVRAADSIVANNQSGGDCVLIESLFSPTFSDDGYNIFEDGSCISSSTSSMGDPLLGPLANNGGPTLTHALSPDSPALDAGDSDFCPDTDQRGYPRPVDGNKDGTAECDIGSYEYILLDYYMALPMVTR